MKDIQLGTTPAPDAKRDAIHIAVYPAIAGEDLNPGNHVGVKDGAEEEMRDAGWCCHDADEPGRMLAYGCVAYALAQQEAHREG